MYNKSGFAGDWRNSLCALVFFSCACVIAIVLIFSFVFNFMWRRSLPLTVSLPSQPCNFDPISFLKNRLQRRKNQFLRVYTMSKHPSAWHEVPWNKREKTAWENENKRKKNWKVNVYTLKFNRICRFKMCFEIRVCFYTVLLITVGVLIVRVWECAREFMFRPDSFIIWAILLMKPIFSGLFD